ncbi:MAG: hypothetical protein JKX94_00355 [Sneathiella sp.]|nr:hypothetical protein [Sneathiella sp.]
MKSGVQVRSEPEIEELLEDPIFLALIKCDNLTVDDIWHVIASYRDKVPRQ